MGLWAQGSALAAPTDAPKDSAVTRQSTPPQANKAPEAVPLGDKRKSSKGSLTFLLGLGAFLLFGLLRFVYSKHISDLIGVLSRSTLGRMTSKDSLWYNFMPRGLFMLIYYATTGYVVGELIAYLTELPAGGFEVWLWGVAVIVALALLKWLAVMAVATVFSFHKTARIFFNHLSVVNQALGFILLPLCGAMLLLPGHLTTILLFASLFVLFISLIFKLLINVAYVRNLTSVSFLHFILYLCTLEIIPLAVCARYVHNSLGV